MTSISNKKMVRVASAFLVVMLCISMFSAPALAQGFRRPGPPPPPPPPRRSSDFDKALAIVGTVGAVAAIANARNNRYYYYRQPVVVQPRPVVVSSPPVVVERPVVVEKQVVIEKPVVVERQVPVVVGSTGSYSPKLGAYVRIENMQIPGYRFTAARLTSDPAEHSPLWYLGLRKGDVITRLDNTPASTLAALEQSSGNVAMRYIKTGTTKVLLANVYIPKDGEVFDNGTYNAP